MMQAFAFASGATPTQKSSAHRWRQGGQPTHTRPNLLIALQ
jgi:hypothetical protein